MVCLQADISCLALRARSRVSRAPSCIALAPLIRLFCRLMPLVELSVFCIRYFSKTKCKPAKKITGQCFSTEVKAACTHSANLERETEITKIVTYPLFPLAFSIMLFFCCWEFTMNPKKIFLLKYHLVL